jgi:hypothetical protein
MYRKILSISLFLLIFCFKPSEIQSLEQDHYIQALASLIYHTQHVEVTDEEIAFSTEDVLLLWDKAAQGLTQHPRAFEKAYQTYYQAQAYIRDGQYNQAQEALATSSYLLTTLWNRALDQEEASYLDPSLPSFLALRAQKDINFENNPYLSSEIKNQMRPYLIPFNHPMKDTLDGIFRSSRVTTDKETFRQAGFRTISSRPRSYIRVARHSSLPGHLVKAYMDTELRRKESKESWKWLVKRCEGAHKIHSIIKKRHIQYFTVAHKWIYPLPATPSPPQDAKHTRHLAILLVTDMNLVPKEMNEHAWSHYITKEHLNELYTIMSYARGSSYRADNIAYTRSGTFAFIDTEYPSRGPDYHSIRKYLDPDMRYYWDKIVRNGGPL